jgi:hypothetical protein
MPTSEEEAARAVLNELDEITHPNLVIKWHHTGEQRIAALVAFARRAKAEALREAADMLDGKAEQGDPTGGEDYYGFGASAYSSAAETLRDLAAKLEETP